MNTVEQSNKKSVYGEEEQTRATVEIEDLTFEDWLNISGACDNSAKWGLYRWLETSSHLKEVSLEGWKAIAETMDYSNTWAAKKYMEYNP